MNHTINYSLKKPDLTDKVNINDLNSNVDIIDEELKKVNESLTNSVSDLTSQLENILNSDIIHYIGISDGVTDVTDDLQNVINSLGWNGGKIFLMGETYKIGETKHLVVPKNVELIGMNNTMFRGSKFIINYGVIENITFWNYNDTSVNNYKAINGGIVRNCKSIGCYINSIIEGCYLPNTITKLMDSSLTKAKIGLFGDSLIAGAGTGKMWWQLLFDQFNASNNELNLITQGFSNTPYISDVKNYGIGGTTAHNLMMLLGSERETINSSEYIASTIQGDYTHFSNILTQNLDLAIISIGANGGNWSDHLLERFIRELRSVGTEVILLTANPRRDAVEFADEFSEKYKALAIKYACEVADTNAYVKNAILTNKYTLDEIFADNIHMAVKGHELYAECILDIFKKNSNNKNAFTPYSKSSQYLYEHSTLESFPNEIINQYEPRITTGTKVSLQTSNLNDLFIHKLPIYNTGRNMNDNIVTKLLPGQFAEFECDSAIGVNLMTDQRADAKVEIRYRNDIILGTVSLNIAHGAYFPYEGVEFGNYEGNSFISKPIRVYCTEGEVYLIGVSFLSLKRESIEKVNMNGTWNNKTELNVNVRYTDNIGDSLSFTFNGTGVSALLGWHECGGKIEITIDGKIYKTIDCYMHSTGTVLKNITLGGLTDKKHYCCIKLIGVNNQAVLPNTKHKLEIFQLNKLI